MIRVTQRTNLEGVDDLIQWFEDFEDVAYSEFQDVVNEVEPAMLSELRDTPPNVKYPIGWTTEKQKRAFFATNGFGRGIPTRRTGKVQQGWVVFTDRGDGTFTVKVMNDVSYSRWVYGSLAKTGQQYQQRFHRNTGWQPANETVFYWLDVIRDEYAAKMRRIADTIKTRRRAFTR